MWSDIVGVFILILYAVRGFRAWLLIVKLIIKILGIFWSSMALGL
jgi:hypothetical protein